MNTYQQQQLQGQRLVRLHLQEMPAVELDRLSDQVAPYLEFRRQVDRFLERHCGGFCTRSCFENQMSACCSRDGIITFWADLVVNALKCDDAQTLRMTRAIQNPLHPRKCIYLGSDGCRWQVRPLVCAMFLCDQVTRNLIRHDPSLAAQWSDLNRRAKGFRWPDRPVLFDVLEKVFLDRGCQSDLMFLHNSPGLLRIKRKAGLA